MSKGLRTWETVSRKTVLQHSEFLTVENHTVRLPDGREIADWAWVIAPSAAIVVALTEDGQFLCFRQTKYAVEGTTLAPVGGMLEPDEAPGDAARRELREEMGYEAGEWVNLGSYVLEANRGMGMRHLFLALDCRRVAEPDSDDLEDQELLLLSRDEIERALRAGEFKVVAWAAAVALALNHLTHRDSRPQSEGTPGGAG
jgi:ADP-ribose pyrophosphatase